ncbi:MAG: DGQHR domain-containing protein [Fimbriimonadaceae bacterium]
MPKGRKTPTLFEPDELDMERQGEVVSYTASLITQGKSRFYTLAMPSDVLAKTCTVDTHEADPVAGFQRRLDESRAQDIADYIDKGLGTIPGSIVLSAQPEAHLEYNRPKRTLRFQTSPRAFLILDGQHRVYGFQKAKARLRVPVVIYNNLSKAEEARLFMDINTKQRPVPNELLLAIKRLAQTETNEEAILKDIFDSFDKDSGSPLLGLMSSAERKKGKISRVTFNAALKPIFSTFDGSASKYVYDVLSAYVQAWLSGLRSQGIGDRITNSTLFRALMLLFPVVAEKVSDRYGEEFTADNFVEVLRPVFSRTRTAALKSPGKSPGDLYDSLRGQLESGFSLGRRRE